MEKEYAEYEERVKNMLHEVEKHVKESDELTKQIENIKSKMDTKWNQKKKEIETRIKATEEAVFLIEEAVLKKDKDKALKEAQLHKVQLQIIQQQMQQIKKIKDEAEQLEASTCKPEALASLQQQVKELEQKAQQAKELEKQAQQNEWDEYYMKIACLAALRSKDPKTPVSYSTTHWDNIHVLYIITGWCLHC